MEVIKIAAEVTSQVDYNAIPALGKNMWVFTYTKATQNDTIAVATYATGIRTILYAIANIDADGSDDPCTISGTSITLTSATTGAGRILIVGTG